MSATDPPQTNPEYGKPRLFTAVQIGASVTVCA